MKTIIVSVKVVINLVFPMGLMAGHQVCAAAQQCVCMPIWTELSINHSVVSDVTHFCVLTVHIAGSLHFDMHMWSTQQTGVVVCWSSHTVSCPACR